MLLKSSFDEVRVTEGLQVLEVFVGSAPGAATSVVVSPKSVLMIFFDVIDFFHLMDFFCHLHIVLNNSSSGEIKMLVKARERVRACVYVQWACAHECVRVCFEK